MYGLHVFMNTSGSVDEEIRLADAGESEHGLPDG